MAGNHGQQAQTTGNSAVRPLASHGSIGLKLVQVTQNPLPRVKGILGNPAEPTSTRLKRLKKEFSNLKVEEDSKAALQWTLDQLLEYPALAASCLAVLVSSMPKSKLRDVVPSVLENAEAALSNGCDVQAASKLLKLIAVGLERAGPLTPAFVGRLAEALPAWLFQQVGRSFKNTLRTPFIAGRGDVAPREANRRRGSGSSIAWSDSDASVSSETSRRDVNNTTRLKLEALACLRALHTVRYATTFFAGNFHYRQTHLSRLRAHWLLFLPDTAVQRQSLLSLIASDPSIEVRIAACETLTVMLKGAKAFLAVAEDRPSKASFVSLSARVAFLTIEVHRVLGTALNASLSMPQLSLVLLQAVVATAQATSYPRFTTSILPLLLHPVARILHCGDGQEVTHQACSAARHLLDAVEPSSPQMRDEILTDIASGLEELLNSTEERLLTATWLALASVAKHDSAKGGAAAELASQRFSRSSAAVQIAQLAFASAMETVNLLSLFDLAAVSPESAVRKACCDQLAAMPPSVRPSESILNKVTLPLCHDADVAVKRSALRLLSFQVKTCAIWEDQALFRAIMNVLTTEGRDASVIAAKAWTFASLFDDRNDQWTEHGTRLDSRVLLKRAISFSSADKSAACRISGVRALSGATLLAEKQSCLRPEDSHVIYETLIGAMACEDVKLQWNALTTLTRLLGVQALTASSVTFEAVCHLLASSPNLKVRLAAVQWLHHRGVELMNGDAQATLASIEDALHRLDDEDKDLPFTEMAHARALREALVRADEDIHAVLLKPGG